MPRRLILSATERDTLLALPESQDDLIRYYTFNDSDLSLIRQRFEGGITSEIDLRTAESALQSARVAYAQTQRQRLDQGR